MLLFKTTDILPAKKKKRFQAFRFGILFITVFAFAFVLSEIVFSPESFTYQQGASIGSNTLSRPTDSNGRFLKKNLLRAGSQLITYAGTDTPVTQANISLSLTDDSNTPQTLSLSIRKSYRSFFSPDGNPITLPSLPRLFVIDRTYYLWETNGKLSPITNEVAAYSHLPKNHILPNNEDLFKLFPPRNSSIGLRRGILLSDERTVYIVSGDNALRPFGNDRVFEALGYDWNKVIPVRKETLSFYTKGPLLRFNSEHPDGTIFYDQSTNRYFLIKNGEKHRIEDDEYIAFLLETSGAITASSAALETKVSCTLKRSPFFRQTYSCSVPLDILKQLPGQSYELSIETETDIQVHSIHARFETETSVQNAKQFFERFRDRQMYQ